MNQIVVVDARMPCREASAGERATIDQVDALLSLGHQVLFTSVGQGPDDRLRAQVLQRRGWQVAPGHGGGSDHLRNTLAAHPWDVVIVHRPGPALMALGTLAKAPAVTVYMGHDIHQWRLRAQQAQRADVDPHQLQVTKVCEQRCWAGFDLTVYPTAREAEHVDTQIGIPGRGWAMPYYRLLAEDLPEVAAGAGSGLLMVGSSLHSPNLDAVEWAVRNVAPGVDETLTVVGDWPEPQRPSDARVRFTGRVTEDQLRELHAGHLALLAPLRFGAGARRKLVAAMGFGLPVITMPEGVRGLYVDDARPSDPLIVAEDAPSMIAAIRDLRESPPVWEALAQRGQVRVAQVYGQAVYDQALQAMLDAARHAHDLRRAA